MSFIARLNPGSFNATRTTTVQVGHGQYPVNKAHYSSQLGLVITTHSAKTTVYLLSTCLERYGVSDTLKIKTGWELGSRSQNELIMMRVPVFTTPGA